MKIAKRNKCRGIVCDDARILETDKGNEKADTRRDGKTQKQWHAIDNLLAQTCKSQEDEEQSLDKNCCQCELPCVAHYEHNGVGKEGIQSHAWCQREWQLGIDGHHKCGNNR